LKTLVVISLQIGRRAEMIEMETLVVGELAANCYLISSKEVEEAVVIDPGGEGSQILNRLKEKNLSVKYIINTHGHIDHTAANPTLSEVTGAPILIHKDDASYLEDPVLSLRQFLGQRVDSIPPDRLLEDREEFLLGNLRFEVIHTPGHTEGSITISVSESGEDIRYLFTGDTLFREGVGRTDLPGGSYKRLMDSIATRLLPLADESIVYPGHGPSSTIGWERKNNPFLR